MKTTKSKKLYKQALKLMPGGVNSPVRAFKAVGGNPLFIAKAKGSKIYDVDGNEYIDYVLSWGPLILGHAYPSVVKALKKAIEKGTSYGAPTELEIKLATLVKKAFPSIEKLRFVNSGTEATMSAIRVARGFTKRNKVIKFEGCYHGHVDGLLVSAGSGGATFSIPDSLGVPQSYTSETIVLPFNDINTFKNTLKEHWKDIACVIVEPVVGNMGCILPKDEFLKVLRNETQKYGIVLIFDEVMTGFRVSFGGAQQYYGVKPDLTCLGKVIGGGLPVGAYGGKKEIMALVAPDGGVYQAGTLSGNPITMTAGIETLKVLSKASVYKRLEKTMQYLEEGLKDSGKQAGINVKFYRAGTMFCTYFTENEVIDAKTAKTSDTEKFKQFFLGMLQKGVYIAPSQFEAGFISLAHSEKDIEKTVQAAYKIFKKL
ncbi:glutamate-1-semialdehyde 2,1-aminomutase [Thermodesulfovibrio yellowstonii]|uniref:glutamate-1-semialdehyde 2,1-aminomutase n=1 Tax=Thermodesulfovibrio yellowstonii TaxID=28262 RepID=UPI0024B36A6C|nr:glutamate-1-semialdehyde 2,1-aminomutase [Thermodesulfovibrio yellowstonii]MDI6865260.1 glutamate-1-semialdehyde 2,1-aminomutase [Thermodesulfovibrio yellowstonii]